MDKELEMRGQRSRWIHTRRLGLLGAVLALFFALAPGAFATPVTVWYEGAGCPACFGIDAASVSAFQAAGGQVLQGPGLPLFSDASGSQIQVTTPDSTLSGFVPPGPISRSNPVTGSNTWLVDAIAQSYSNLWLVFRGLSPSDTSYLPGEVGLEVDPTQNWFLLQPDPEGFPNVYYVALFLGDALQNTPVPADVHYRVARALVSSGGSLVFPQHLVGFMVAPLPAPEPGTAALLMVAGVAGWTIRRRRC